MRPSIKLIIVQLAPFISESYFRWWKLGCNSFAAYAICHTLWVSINSQNHLITFLLRKRPEMFGIDPSNSFPQFPIESGSQVLVTMLSGSAVFRLFEPAGSMEVKRVDAMFIHCWCTITTIGWSSRSNSLIDDQVHQLRIQDINREFDSIRLLC